VRDVRHAPIIEFSPPHEGPDQSPGASTVSAQKYQKGLVDPSA
jgi:hypothetical protein